MSRRPKEVDKCTKSNESHRIMVVGTMSSGKSTLINAIIGRELLPSANEATTACIVNICHDKNAKTFSGACFDASGNKIAASHSASINTVKEWNNKKNVKHICLTGRFFGKNIQKSDLALNDTPGPNYSQDKLHGEIMLEALQKNSFNTLIYILDVSQLGINDDRNILYDVRKKIAESNNIKIYFILNKIDLLDPEKGEDRNKYIEQSRLYLENAGFSSPVIIPVMAYTALTVRKALVREPMTRTQQLVLEAHLDGISDDPAFLGISKLQHAAILIIRLLIGKALQHRIIRNRKLKKLELFSGITTIERICFQCKEEVIK